MADFTPEEIEQFREQFRKLNEELKRLGGTAFKEMPSDINDVVKAIKSLSNEIHDIKNAFGSISQTLKNTITDFNSAGKLISSINNSYGKLSSLTSKVQEHINGTNLLSVKELKNIQAKAKIEVDNLKNQKDAIAGKLSEEGISERQRKILLSQQLELNEAFKEQKSYLLSINSLLDEEIEKEKEINKNLGLTGNLYKGISKTLQRFGIDIKIIEDMGNKLREAADPEKNGGKVGFKKLFGIIKEGFKEALEDPIFKFTLGLKLAQSGINDLKKAFEVFKEFNTIFVETARSIGMSVGQVTDMVKQVNYADNSIQGLNGSVMSNVYSVKQLTKAISDVNTQLGLSVNVGTETLDEFTAMTNQMGLSADEATKIYKLGLLNNMSLKDTNKTITSSIIAVQKQTGVQINARQVLQEIGKLSTGITTKFQQNPEALAKAVAQAKALGTNLEQVDKVSESILNFESSIENELKAELLTGKQINLEKARYAALTGDQATLTQELADQVGSLAEFQEMNVLAQKSLAEAFGLSRDEVADMLTKQETFNKLGDVSEKSAQEQLKIAKERGLSETDSLMVNLKQQAVAEKLTATFDSFKTILAELVSGPMGGLVDAMGFLAKNAWIVTTALGAMAAMSFVKTIGGLAVMATQLGIISAGAITASQALSFGLTAVAIGAGIGLLMSLFNSAKAEGAQSVSDGISPSSKGPFTITDAYGATAITAVGDGLAVSPNINTTPLNQTRQPSFNTSAITEAIATLSNTVSGLVNRPQPTPQFALNVDGRILGTVVGRQMETGTSQIINTGYQMA
jgi:hypothetical protein